MNIKGKDFQEFNYENEDNIDFREIKNSLLINRSLILKFTLSGLILSIFFALFTKKTWQGEFQIVLNNTKSTRNIGGLSILNQMESNTFNEVLNNDKDLKTEVEILKSPSILMKIFDFVKLEKSKNNEEEFDKIRFNKWKNKHLKIELEKGTTILNISYRDNDKKIIIPVLNKISKTYQDYSGSRRLRDIELGINYFGEQIEIYRDKSVKSLREAQEFAIDQDLSIIQSEKDIDKEIPNVINIEQIRLEAANKIRIIDQQLSQINNLSDDPYQIIYTASIMPTLSELSNELKNNERSIAKLSKIYTQEDKILKELKEKRILLTNLLTSQVKGFLIAQRADTEAKLKAAERPKGVMIKYRQLLSIAKKDQSTLNVLEDSYRKILLEKARSEDPWELITTPTLLRKPISPIKRIYAILGLASGLITGIAITFVIEKKKNIVYSLSTIERECTKEIVLELSEKEEEWKESLEFFSNGSLLKLKGDIAFIMVGEIEENQIEIIKNNLKDSYLNGNIKFTKNLIETLDIPNVLLLVKLGNTNKDKILDWEKKLKTQSNHFIGIIVLN